ncbi:hypothetical protein BDR22DRAFT_832707 [Usnea florida]
MWSGLSLLAIWTRVLSSTRSSSVSTSPRFLFSSRHDFPHLMIPRISGTKTNHRPPTNHLTRLSAAVAWPALSGQTSTKRVLQTLKAPEPANQTKKRRTRGAARGCIDRRTQP